MKKFSHILSLLSFLTVTACGPAAPSSQSSASSSARTGPISVVASFYPLAYFAEQIGGDAVSITQVTPGGTEPHDYEPSPADITAAHAADVFLMNGNGVDSWADRIIDDLRQSGVHVLRMSDNLTIMPARTVEGETETVGPNDPHVWLDPVNVEQEVAGIRDILIAADPAHAQIFNTNSRGILQRLGDLDAEYKQGLAHCSLNTVIVSHDAFRYMAARYGFDTLPVAGLSPDQEPSPQTMANIIQFAKKHYVGYVFFETLANPKLAQTLASEIGAQTLVLNPLEGLTADELANGDDYFSVMQDNLKNLKIALKCK